MIHYQQERELAADEFAALLVSSGLAPRRPGDLGRLDAMLRGAQLIVTARDKGRLVGLARSITDFSYCLYCADLCVDINFQGRGIGTRLLEQSAAAVPGVTTCLLLSAPDAVTFYEKAGFQRHAHAFLFA
ncbi:MAG: GNAT family N-acetyltransferase [Roseinatronobacter sp.]